MTGPRLTSSRSGSATWSARSAARPNTHVRLIIQPHDSKDKKVYDIVRQKVEMTESHAKGQVIETKADGKTLKVGVIALPAFYGDSRGMAEGDADAVSCTSDCQKLIEGFKAKGVDAVMMDLRGNGGGLLNEAISLSGLFIDTGPVVQVREANSVKHLDDDDAGHRLGWPAGRPDRPPERQRLGDLRGRDQGLRSRADHRRRQHLRQGDRPADHADQGRVLAPPATPPTWARSS